MIFENRYLAGEHLSIILKNKIQDLSDTIILWILKWWAQVTYKLAEETWLNATFLSIRPIIIKNRKIWVITQDWSTVYNKVLIWKLWIDPEEIKEKEKQILEEVKFDKEKYDIHFKNFTWKQVIVVDDWVISWLTAAAAWRYVKENWANRIILATPVANSKLMEALKKFYNEIIVADAVEDRNFALSKFYMSYYSLWSEDIYEIIHKLKDKQLRINNW